jgi:Alginate export
VTRRPARSALCGTVAAISIVVAAAQAGQSPASGPAHAAADATLTLRGRTAALGVGFAWGASSVEFQGKTYPVRVDGFVFGGLGTASLEGVGEVFGLTKIEDLNGNYTALASGGAFGEGTGKLVMRNDKGVRIVMDVKGAGLQVGAGPRGITLSVGEAGGPPADASPRLPQTLGFGELKTGPLYFSPTLNAQVFTAASGNPGFNGKWSFGPVDKANNWFEHSNEVGLNARYPTGNYGTLEGRVSGVYSLTASGPDGAVSNGSRGTVTKYTLESAHLAWQSEDLFPQLGHNAIELSAGNQNYQVFDGLLFWDGGQDSTNRGANWLSPRKAFRETGIARLNLNGFMLEGVHLKYNDDPDTGTRLGAGRVEYVKDDWLMKYLKVGFMYFDIYESDTASRDGMNGIYVYHEAIPLPALESLSYKTSFVRESNAKSSGLSEAYGWYVTPAYKLSSLPWKPQLSYRYASFTGGGTRAFDSLFTGLSDWGSWFQGELLGEYVLSDSNSRSNQVRLLLKPNEILTLNLIYYKFLLDNRNQDFGLTPSRVSRSLADEVDLIVDMALTNWWSLTATCSVANPNAGFREAVNGSATWINGYLYMNFTF